MATQQPQRWILRSESVRDGLVRTLSVLRIDVAHPLEVVLRRYRKSLSDEQRNYYRGVVLKTISDATGYTADELHEMFKAKFGTASIIELAGETYEVRTFSTARDHSTTAEMAHYIDAIILWSSAELGIVVPPPTYRGEPVRARDAEKATT